MASFSLLQWCLISILFGSTFAQLNENIYSKSCPQASSLIKEEVKYTLKKDPGMGASLLHLHFQDCGAGGCDGSILLDDTPSSKGEKSTFVNMNKTRGYEVIDRIKARLEKACPRVVSCADILAVVARDSVVGLGGPNWNVPLGRRDSTESHRFLTEALAPFVLLGARAIILAFEAKGFTKNEFVALQGSHTVGMARCSTYKSRIYGDTNIDPAYAASLKAKCPKEGGDDTLTPLDSTTPYVFDNAYFVNLMKKKGLLAADQELYTGTGGVADAIVANYSSSKENFFKNYVSGIVKFGKMGVLTGKDGEIRTNCRKVNGAKA